jgi:hypothetical protein
MIHSRSTTNWKPVFAGSKSDQQEQRDQEGRVVVNSASLGVASAPRHRRRA